jgi:hypothetical protein
MASPMEKMTRQGPGGGPVVANEAGARVLRLQDGTALEITEHRYPGGARGLMLSDVETREPYGILTVNVPGTKLAPDEILVKTWSENADLADEVLQDPRFEDTGRRVATGGRGDGAEAEVWRYRPEAAPPKVIEEAAGSEWRGTLKEAIDRAVAEHGVQAFAGGDWRGNSEGRGQSPEDLAQAIERARAQVTAKATAERVYTVRPDGTIYNTATRRDEWVPVALPVAWERKDGAPRPSRDAPREGSASGANATRGPAGEEPEVGLTVH